MESREDKARRINKVRCVVKLVALEEPFIARLGVGKRSSRTPGVCTMSSRFHQGYFAGIGRQCMIEASARLSMCAACVSSALAITCVTGEKVSTSSSHIPDEQYLPGQTIAFSNIIAAHKGSAAAGPLPVSSPVEAPHPRPPAA
ncbi:2992_t:CDS:2 [Scutellospora calospora]|uniref:2992_t:CDS:1 n=1 Tax=Scutellospora calospora TaxID=85575 RepID=A0ACA9PMH5_9GLOM|nr:2992_t:CDS:2 [Scutellospora calospora]